MVMATQSGPFAVIVDSTTGKSDGEEQMPCLLVHVIRGRSAGRESRMEAVLVMMLTRVAWSSGSAVCQTERLMLGGSIRCCDRRCKEFHLLHLA
eukprot:scaffold7489_cov96-Cylindrotheca_fusiformis.AAC.8